MLKPWFWLNRVKPVRLANFYQKPESGTKCTMTQEQPSRLRGDKAFSKKELWKDAEERTSLLRCKCGACWIHTGLWDRASRSPSGLAHFLLLALSLIIVHAQLLKSFSYCPYTEEFGWFYSGVLENMTHSFERTPVRMKRKDRRRKDQRLAEMLRGRCQGTRREQ